MNNELQKTCDNFIENRNLLKQCFNREGEAMYSMGAAVMSALDEKPESDRLIECAALLKKLEGLFSPFRGALKLPVVINMAASNDPEEYLKRVRSCYDSICSVRGSRNESYYLKAMELASETEDISNIEAGISDVEDSFDVLLDSLEADNADIDAELREAGDFLTLQKGFGRPGIKSNMKSAYAMMLVCMAHGWHKRAAAIATRLALDDAHKSKFKA